MRYLRLLRARAVVLSIVWALPILTCIAIGTIAIYQTGWLRPIALALPPMYLFAWLIGKFWKPAKLHESSGISPLQAPAFWTSQDTEAIAVVETFRKQVADIDRASALDYNRYVQDAQQMGSLLAAHYHASEGKNALHPLTVIDVLAVIHLAVEDLEAWVLENVPGSDRATMGQLQRLPTVAKAVDWGSAATFLVSAAWHPAKLLAYPLWRKSGQLTFEIQNELVRAFYQMYLRRVGYYLIEMYSGRLKGGSRAYRKQFHLASSMMHDFGGNIDRFAQLTASSTTIAVIGQVNAGKSSLINALTKGKHAKSSVLPETNEVRRVAFDLPESDNTITLLDTPGYGESGVSKQQQSAIRKAAQSADLILLVMAANCSARDSDVQVIRDLAKFYETKKHLRNPPVIGVLTHIDLLRPIREWSPPYDWRDPTDPKSESIAAAAAYVHELMGGSIVDCVCVYSGDDHPDDGSVSDTLAAAIVQHLPAAKATAMVRAFHDQLSKQRLDGLKRQLLGMLRFATGN